MSIRPAASGILGSSPAPDVPTKRTGNKRRDDAAPKKTRWKPAFLRAFALSGNVSWAALQAGIDRRTAQRARQADETFALAWADAEEVSHDRLEQEAFRRAVEGVEKPVTVAGEREVVQDFSDTLLIFLLKARRPEKYRERFDIKHSVPQEQVARFAADLSEIATSSDPPEVRAERTDALLAEIAGEQNA